MTLHIIVDDIVIRNDDAIVNAANELLAPGGGVCGAIHRAAGAKLAEACAAIGHCKTGSAVVTPGFDLKAGAVIHAVGPRWIDGKHNEEQLLAQCYQNIFALVQLNHFDSVAIPAISTGIYGFPLYEATKIAISVARKYDLILKTVSITFVCFSNEIADIYYKVLDGQG